MGKRKPANEPDVELSNEELDSLPDTAKVWDMGNGKFTMKSEDFIKHFGGLKSPAPPAAQAAEEVPQANTYPAVDTEKLGTVGKILHGVGKVGNTLDLLVGDAATRGATQQALNMAVKSATGTDLKIPMATREEGGGPMSTNVPSWVDVLNHTFPTTAEDKKKSPWLSLAKKGGIFAAGMAGDILNSPWTYTGAGAAPETLKEIARVPSLWERAGKLASRTLDNASTAGIAPLVRGASHAAFNNGLRPVDAAVAAAKGKGPVSDALLKLGYAGQNMSTWLPEAIKNINTNIESLLKNTLSGVEASPEKALDQIEEYFKAYEAITKKPYPNMDQIRTPIYQIMEGTAKDVKIPLNELKDRLSLLNNKLIPEHAHTPNSTAIDKDISEAANDVYREGRNTLATSVDAATGLGKKFKDVNQAYSTLISAQRPLISNYGRVGVSDIRGTLQKRLAPWLYQGANSGAGKTVIREALRTPMNPYHPDLYKKGK